MRHKARMICFILSGTLSLSSLTGCGTDSDDSFAVSTETIQSENAADASKDEIEIFQTEDINKTVVEAEFAEIADVKESILSEKEERLQAEVEAAEAERIKREQLNSFSIMYYLAITAEEIRTSKDNRLILEDIYTSLLNDINPGAIDEITQDHLKNLRDIIKEYLSVSVKRERLQYIYNQEKAAAIRSAVPDPIGILSMANSFDWTKLAVSVVYTVIDSYTGYKNASEAADSNYLTSGWELDDEEVAAIQKNRDRAFDYMVDMVQEYDLDGELTLNEQAIETFAEICAIESAPEKIKRLLAEEDTYQLLGNYWLELADCYFETAQYSKCLACVDEYNGLSTGIYRKDYNYAQILPKAITAARKVYSGSEFVTVISGYADSIVSNTSTTDWSTRYFAAQVYLDLYSQTENQDYLKKAYKIASENVTVLLSEQRSINATYLEDVVEVQAEEPDYAYMTESEKKEAKKAYKAEKKRVKAYNKELKKTRKTELPTLYEPLMINCELLFSLADEMNLDAEEKADIDAILKTSTNGIFIVAPINDFYSFGSEQSQYNLEINENEIVIPANLLTSGSTITVLIRDGDKEEILEDCKISKVERTGSTIDTFKAHVSSKQFKKYKWTENSEVTVEITYGDAYDKSIELEYAVIEFEDHWYGDKVVFAEK